jgi:hypothetical protein
VLDGLREGDHAVLSRQQVVEGRVHRHPVRLVDRS